MSMSPTDPTEPHLEQNEGPCQKALLTANKGFCKQPLEKAQEK